MKKTVIVLFIVTIIMSTLCSCASIREESIQSSGSARLLAPVTTSTDSLDRFHVVSTLQSAPGPILMQHIVRKGESYVLVLSEEDALSLGIKQDDYQYYKMLIENSTR